MLGVLGFTIQCAWLNCEVEEIKTLNRTACVKKEICVSYVVFKVFLESGTAVDSDMAEFVCRGDSPYTAQLKQSGAHYQERPSALYGRRRFLVL